MDLTNHWKTENINYISKNKKWFFEGKKKKTLN